MPCDPQPLPALLADPQELRAFAGEHAELRVLAMVCALLAQSVRRWAMGMRLVEAEDTFVDEPRWRDWPHLAPVRQLMTPASLLVTVPRELGCGDADTRAREAKVRHLLVGDTTAPLGVLCRCDLAAAPPDARVDAVMHASVFAAAPALTLGEAAIAMARLGIGCLPVIDAGRVVGMITRGDLRRAGAPEQLLGAHVCCDCGSVHAVRTGPHGLDYCLDCLEIEELDGD